MAIPGNSALKAKALKAYTQEALEVEVTSASPMKLVVMLYEGAMLALTTAKVEMEKRNFIEKGQQITKAIDILEGLRVAVDKEQIEKGVDLAANLHDLYQYMKQRLVMANLKNDVEIVDEVYNLLSELHSAWAELNSPSSAATQPVDPSTASVGNKA